jgi:hypothetical protein
MSACGWTLPSTTWDWQPWLPARCLLFRTHNFNRLKFVGCFFHYIAVMPLRAELPRSRFMYGCNVEISMSIVHSRVEGRIGIFVNAQAPSRQCVK